jgi:pimeloyl-ACP methyl ester carboxylesterase
MNIIMKKKTLFIPGGPWISGKYWDFYLQDFPPKFNAQRHVLINHEKEYSKTIFPTVQDAVEKIKNEILSSDSIFSVVAHSYGAWLAILATDKEVLKKIDSIILVNMPVKLDQTKKFKELVENSNHQSFKNNSEFSLYFSDILIGYFYEISKADKFRNLTKYSYMESNEKLLIEGELLTSCLDRIRILKDKIHFIYSDNDLIIGKSWEKLFPDSYLIENCGHFPMLEKPEKFSKLLYSLL